MTNEDTKNSSNWTWVLLAIGSFLVTVFVILPLFGSQNQDIGQEVGVGGGPEQIINRRVTLAGVPVREVVNDRVFWVGPNDTQRLLLVVDKAVAGSTASIKSGETVSFTAVIKKIPSTDEMRKEWSLDEEKTGLFQGEQLYLFAEDIKKDQE